MTVLRLLAAQYNVSQLLLITQQEWENKQVSPETLKSLGLKGSPKLSKVLTSLGIPKDVVASSLSGGSQKYASKILSSPEDCLDQGNSIHYNSCQATDPRARSTYNPIHYKADKDVCFMGTDLFLWVVGEPMHRNGEGYLARAKIRVIYSDSDLAQKIGLYVDRMYGQISLLALHQLEKWWRERGEDTPLLKLGTKWKGFSPSSLGGYQDTISWKTGEAYFDPLRVSLLKEAYLTRPKVGGTYIHNLKEVMYNPQSIDPFNAPQYSPKRWRGIVPDFVKPVVTHYYRLIGSPELPIDYRKKWKSEEISISNTLMGKECCLTYTSFNAKYKFSVEDKVIYTQEPGLLQVWKECSVLGYSPPEKIPYKCKDVLTVVRTLTAFGWAEAVELPFRVHSNGLIVNEDHPNDGWSKSVKLPYVTVTSNHYIKVVENIPHYGWMKAEPVQPQPRRVELSVEQIIALHEFSFQEHELQLRVYALNWISSMYPHWYEYTNEEKAKIILAFPLSEIKEIKKMYEEEEAKIDWQAIDFNSL